MIKLHKVILCSFLIFCLSSVNAQHNHTRQCEVIVDSEDHEIITKNQKAIDAFLLNGIIENRDNGVIPLVFHFVLKDGSDSITRMDVLKQIEVMNECFNAQNKDLSKLPETFRSIIPNTGIRFCLASKTIDDITYEGIELVYTNEENIGDLINIEGKRSIKYNTLGGLDAWDSQLYLNIWVGDLSFAQGSATFPNTVDEQELGLIIDPDYFGVHEPYSSYYPFHLGKTLVHETGHYFNLLHTWGQDASCNSDDGIGDTPLQGNIYTDCPAWPQSTCGSEDMFMNFMNFTDDECLLSFTKEQMESMEACIRLYYPELENSGPCNEMISGENPLDAIKYFYRYEDSSIRLHLPSPLNEKIDISLYSIDGKLLHKEELFGEREEEFSLSGYQTGIYILFLQLENNFIAHKLFVY